MAQSKDRRVYRGPVTRIGTLHVSCASRLWSDAFLSMTVTHICLRTRWRTRHRGSREVCRPASGIPGNESVRVLGVWNE